MNRFHFYPACGLNSYEGYGRAEIGFLKGCYELGLGVDFYPSPDTISLQFGNPKWGASPFMQGQRRWLFTMIESNQASQQWVDNINSHYERIIVPTCEMIDMMRDSGVIVPIHHIPLGVDAFPMPHKKRPETSPFVFMSYSYGDIRKGAELAVMAFRMLYEDNPNYRLVVKARDGFEIAWLQSIQTEQISLVGGAIAEQDLNALWDSVHCFVFPSRAEGFGLPPRESTLQGIPSIATQWLGMADAHEWGYPLSVSSMRPCQYMKEVNNRVGALWAEPSFDDLLHWMQWIPTHYEQALIANTQHRDYLLSNFTWKQVASEFMLLLGEYA